MLGQSWKRVGTYDRELGRQGKGIPIPKRSRHHSHRAARTAFLSTSDKRSVRNWASILGIPAILLGLGIGVLLNTQSPVNQQAPSLTLPTFDSPKDTIPCVRRVSLLRQDMDSTTQSSSSTAKTTEDAPSSSTMPSPTTSSSTSQRGTTTHTILRSSIRTPQQQLKDQPEMSAQPPSQPKPKPRIQPAPMVPKASATIRPQSPQPVQQERRERLVPSTSQPIKPQPTGQPSIPKREPAPMSRSTMPSSDSSAKQENSQTGGRNTTVMTSPSKSCSPS